MATRLRNRFWIKNNLGEKKKLPFFFQINQIPDPTHHFREMFVPVPGRRLTPKSRRCTAPHCTSHRSLAPCPCVPKTRPRHQRPRCRLTGLAARTRAPPPQQPSPAPLVARPLLHLLSARLDARGTCSAPRLRQARASPGCDVSAARPPPPRARAPFTQGAHAPWREAGGGRLAAGPRTSPAPTATHAHPPRRRPGAGGACARLRRTPLALLLPPSARTHSPRSFPPRLRRWHAPVRPEPWHGVSLGREPHTPLTSLPRGPTARANERLRARPRPALPPSLRCGAAVALGVAAFGRRSGAGGRWRPGPRRRRRRQRHGVWAGEAPAGGRNRRCSRRSSREPARSSDRPPPPPPPPGRGPLGSRPSPDSPPLGGYSAPCPHARARAPAAAAVGGDGPLPRRRGGLGRPPPGRWRWAQGSRRCAGDYAWSAPGRWSEPFVQRPSSRQRALLLLSFGWCPRRPPPRLEWAESPLFGKTNLQPCISSAAGLRDCCVPWSPWSNLFTSRRIPREFSSRCYPHLS